MNDQNTEGEIKSETPAPASGKKRIWRIAGVAFAGASIWLAGGVPMIGAVTGDETAGGCGGNFDAELAAEGSEAEGALSTVSMDFEPTANCLPDLDHRFWAVHGESSYSIEIVEDSERRRGEASDRGVVGPVELIKRDASCDVEWRASLSHEIHTNGFAVLDSGSIFLSGYVDYRDIYYHSSEGPHVGEIRGPTQSMFVSAAKNATPIRERYYFIARISSDGEPVEIRAGSYSLDEYSAGREGDDDTNPIFQPESPCMFIDLAANNDQLSGLDYRGGYGDDVGRSIVSMHPKKCVDKISLGPSIVPYGIASSREVERNGDIPDHIYASMRGNLSVDLGDKDRMLVTKVNKTVTDSRSTVFSETDSNMHMNWIIVADYSIKFDHGKFAATYDSDGNVLIAGNCHSLSNCEIDMKQCGKTGCVNEEPWQTLTVKSGFGPFIFRVLEDKKSVQSIKSAHILKHITQVNAIYSDGERILLDVTNRDGEHETLVEREDDEASLLLHHSSGGGASK